MDREKENEEKNKDMKHLVEMKERKLNNMQGIMKGFHIPPSFGFRKETKEISTFLCGDLSKEFSWC